MQTVAIIRIAVVLFGGVIFFIFSRRLSSLPVRGYALWSVGFGLVLLNMAIGALYHAEVLPEDWQSRWMPVIGSISGYGGLSVGLILFLIGTYRLVGSLQSYLDTRYYSLVEHSLVGIYLIQDGVFKFVNSCAAELAGYTREDLIGKPFIDVIAPQSRDLVMENIRKRFADEIDEIQYEFTCLKKNGEPLEVEAYGSRTVYDGKPAIQGTLVDITARKRAEKALKARERQQAAVANLGQRALAGLDLGTLMNEAVAAVAETLEVEYCKVLELLPSGDKLLLRAGIGWKPGNVGMVSVGTGINSQAGYTLHTDRPVIVEDLRTETRFHGPSFLFEHNVVSGMSVIIQGQPRPFGVLGAHTTQKRAFTDDDVHFLQTVANILAVAMERRQAEQGIQRSNKLLSAISHAQSQFIAEAEPGVLFDDMLRNLLSLTESEYGFIGEVLYGADGNPYVKTRAITNISWSEETRAFYEKNAPAGLEYKNLKTLFGAVLTTGKPVIANDPSTDPRRGGLPEGHPALNAFLGLPFFHREKLIGMVGIANRPGGYDETLVRDMEPLLLTCANIIEALRIDDERVQAEQALRDSEDCYRDLVENSHDLICTHDLEGRILSINRGAARTLGYDQSALVNRNLREIIVPEFRNKVDAYLETIKKTGFADGLMRIQNAAGEVRLWEYHNTLRTEGVTAPIVRGLAHDLTERKRAEEEINRLAQAIRSISECICICDLNDRITFVNDAFVNTYGYGRDELIGQPIDLVRLPSEPASALQQIHQETISGGWHGELINRKKDGTEFPIFLSTSVVEDENQRPIALVGVALDITERKQAEQALLQTQKLESLGVLAGGIAHDFNNLLVGILGNAGLALMELPPESPAHETVKQIETAGQRAAELARQMLAYSGKGHFVIQPLNLNLLIEEMAHLLQVAISKSVVLKFNFARDLAVIEADATQIRQIVMNLVVNAAEAIGEENGIITITTGAMHVDCEYLAEAYPMPDPKPGDYVFLEVTDSGCGMDAETQTKIFDPFFTTKFTGRGLGLAAVLGIVRGHKGAIKISSTPGQGTTFTVLLPSIETAAAPMEAEHGLRTSSLSGNRNQVLVIDDDDTVRKVTARVLEKLGFSVLQAAGGRDGIEAFRNHAHEITCVLLDLTMPHPTGEEVFREIRRLKPDTPVILMSGYSEQEAISHFAGPVPAPPPKGSYGTGRSLLHPDAKDTERSAGIAGFLKKPYTPDELREQLEKAYHWSKS